MPSIIYALRDPDSKAIRYIGETSRPLWRRWAAHLGCFSPTPTKVKSWVESLLQSNKVPLIEVLEELGDVSKAERLRAEKRVIKFYKDLGLNLLNMEQIGRPGKRSAAEIEKQKAVQRANGSHKKMWETRRARYGSSGFRKNSSTE